MLANRDALVQAGGLASVRWAWIDDVALARAVKRSGAAIYLGATVQAASFRKYGTLQSIRQMVTRSAFTQLRFSWALVILTLLSLGVLFGVPIVGAVWASIHADADTVLWYALAGASCFSVAFMLAAYAPALRLYQLPVLWGLTLPAAAAVYGAMTLESALVHTFGPGPKWKGRAPE